MENYSAINKNSDFMKFAGKWMKLENTILSEATQTEKDKHELHSLTSAWTEIGTLYMCDSCVAWCSRWLFVLGCSAAK